MALEFFGWGYTIEDTLYTDHEAEFQGDRPRELGDLALKKRKKETAVKHKTAGKYHSWRPHNTVIMIKLRVYDGTYGQQALLTSFLGIPTSMTLNYLHHHHHDAKTAEVRCDDSP